MANPTFQGRGGPSANCRMPRKAEPFRHFVRRRLVFSGLHVKLPLPEPLILLSFRKDPDGAYGKYLKRRAGQNTLAAISRAQQAHREKIALKPGEYVDGLVAEMEGLIKKRDSIRRAHKLKLGLERMKPFEDYADSVRRFDEKIGELSKRISLLRHAPEKKVRRDIMRSSLKLLRKELLGAAEQNRSEVQEG